MAQPHPPQPVKLIVGMLSRGKSLFTLAEREMQSLWGPLDVHSDTMPFTHTTYYEKEMGAPLLRKFVSFARLIDPGDLAPIKHQTNALEEQLAHTPEGRSFVVARPINLDPGYLDPGKLVRHLWNKHRIVTIPIDYANVQGMRVTPNVYTTLEEIDMFSRAIEDVLANGLPA